MLFLPLNKISRQAKGFTLIEILVVISIIVILAGLLMAVGTSVRVNSQIKYTQTTLKTLNALMREYLAQGNPEPAGTADKAANADMTLTTPTSDESRFVKYFSAIPEFAKKISSLKSSTITDPDFPATTTTVLVDGFGTPIRYIPYNVLTKTEGYFQSAGPDRVFSTLTTIPTPKPPMDDIFSTQP